VFGSLVFSVLVVWFGLFLGECGCLIWVLFWLSLFIFAIKLPTVHLLFIGMVHYAVKTYTGRELVPRNVLFLTFPAFVFSCECFLW